MDKLRCSKSLIVVAISLCLTGRALSAEVGSQAQTSQSGTLSDTRSQPGGTAGIIVPNAGAPVAATDAQSVAQMLSALQTEVTEQRVLLQTLLKNNEQLQPAATAAPRIGVSGGAPAAAVPVPVVSGGAVVAQAVPAAPVVAAPAAAAAPVANPAGALASDADKRSYASGVSLAHELTQSLAVQKSLGITLDQSLVMEGLQDSFAQKPLRMDVGEVQSLMSALNADYFRRAKAQSDAAKVSGDKYRLAFAGENGTFKHDGIWYKIYAPGAGRKLKPTDVATVLLSGSLPDGTVFDNSGALGNAKRVRVGSLMPALSTGLQKIANGGHIVVVVPPAKGYGEMGLPPNIPGGATLIFDVTVQGVNEPGGGVTAP